MSDWHYLSMHIKGDMTGVTPEAVVNALGPLGITLVDDVVLTPSPDEEAGRLLTELRTAGYAIVELPEPDYVDEADDDGHKGYGFNGGALEGWYAYGGRVYAAEGDMSPKDARELAAALLAAADAAEREQ